MSCSPRNHLDGLPLDMLQFLSGILVLGSPKPGTLLLYMLSEEEGFIPWTCWLHSSSPGRGQPLLCKGTILTYAQQAVEASPVLSSLPVHPGELVSMHGSTPVM